MADQPSTKSQPVAKAPEPLTDGEATDAVAPVIAPAPLDPAPVAEAPSPPVVPTVSVSEPTEAGPGTVYVAIRDFTAKFAHQILHFAKDAEVEAHIGAPLRALGAPIRLAERLREGDRGGR